MDNILISVIIPVYNGEQFVERAISSILSQTEKRIELIIVDDGSKDQSGRIADSYAEQYEYIHAVHKANGGISSARNAGIAAAKGRYILFLDADDYLDAVACEELVKVIESHAPDMIDYGWKYVSSSGEISRNLHQVKKNCLLTRDEIRTTILPPLLNLCKDEEHFIYDFSCTKAFKREIINEHKIEFDEGRRVWEDRPFVVWYLRYCESFYSMDQCFYNYVDIPNSLSRRYSREFFRIILENYRMYKEWYGDCYDFDTEYVNTYWAKSIENMIYRSLKEKENRKQIKTDIENTLSNQQVIAWYSKRTCENAFEQRSSRLVVAGKGRSALNGYAFYEKLHACSFMRVLVRLLSRLRRLSD